MTGETRRAQILAQLETRTDPISATALAQQFGVSRQVVVQDVALLRAAGRDITSTNRGYLLKSTKTVNRIFKLRHTDEQMQEELSTIVDLGGRVENVMVSHRVYGTLCADLNIGSRHKIDLFLEDIRSGKSSPLKNITSNYHYHTVEAESEEVLDHIEEALRQKGFWVGSLKPGAPLD